MGIWKPSSGQCVRYAFSPVLKHCIILWMISARQPLVIHLPAPHMCQLTASFSSQALSTSTASLISNAISDSLLSSCIGTQCERGSRRWWCLDINQGRLENGDLAPLEVWKDLKGNSYGGPEVMVVMIVRGWFGDIPLLQRVLPDGLL